MLEYITVTKSPDELKAFIIVCDSILPEYPDAEEIKTILFNNGIKYGIDEEAIVKMVKEKICNVPVEVAKGISPVESTPGRIDILIDISLVGKPRIQKDGSANLRDLSYVVNVKKDTPILRLIPPVKGKEGKTVTGKIIPIKNPPEIHLIAGTGTRLLETDKNILVADTNGAVIIYPNGKAEVLKNKVIQGNVDYSTGNIIFSGNLQINGTIRSGFDVEAEGNITVIGNIEDSRVSSLCNIEVLGGILGSENGKIKCGGKLKCRHLQNFDVIAKEVEVLEDIVHCNIWAENLLTAKSVIGGTVSAGNLIQVKTIGTEAEARTIIDLGSVNILINQKHELLRELTKNAQEIGNVKNSIYLHVRDNMDEKGNLSQDKEIYLNELKKHYQKLFQNNIVLLKEIEKLDEKLKECKIPVLNASVIYPNTIIRAGKIEKMIKEKLTNVSVTLENEQIIIKRS